MEWLWLISLAIAIVVAVLCYRIAESKGRSGVLWGILGFILPIVALIIILVLPGKGTATA
ncbi:MAG: hypothetical protein ACRDNG_12940 [Gaiellaceae bacterium]